MSYPRSRGAIIVSSDKSVHGQRGTAGTRKDAFDKNGLAPIGLDQENRLKGM